MAMPKMEHWLPGYFVARGRPIERPGTGPEFFGENVLLAAKTVAENAVRQDLNFMTEDKRSRRCDVPSEDGGLGIWLPRNG